jgi:hypothetical protein
MPRLLKDFLPFLLQQICHLQQGDERLLFVVVGALFLMRILVVIFAILVVILCFRNFLFKLSNGFNQLSLSLLQTLYQFQQ